MSQVREPGGLQSPPAPSQKNVESVVACVCALSMDTSE